VQQRKQLHDAAEQGNYCPGFACDTNMRERCKDESKEDINSVFGFPNWLQFETRQMKNAQRNEIGHTC
jgi:hypothetical protein